MAATKKPTIPKRFGKKFLRNIPDYDPDRDATGYTFDHKAARLAIQFFSECLKHVKGAKAGEPFDLESWQQAIVANLYGWKDKNGLRRYRECLIFVPKKNGKTTLCAGIILLMMFTDHEPGAEMYSAAAYHDQASLVYEHVRGMVGAEEEFQKRVKIYAASKAIVYDREGTSYKVISAEASTKDGYNSHLVILDELQAQPNRRLVDALITSTGARRQPLIIHATTSDYERPSICNEKHDYASRVRDGQIKDPAFLPVIYEVAEKDREKWQSPRIWKQANPNLGISISMEYLTRECKRAQEQPIYENTFKRYHLNIRTEQAERWLQMATWDECIGAVDEAELAGKECFGGLDLASTKDIAAFVLAFPMGKGYKLICRFWIPRENAEIRERRDKVPYLTWARQGLIKLTEGRQIDYDVIHNDIIELGETFNIREIAFDRWNAAQISTQLINDGFEVISFGQGYASLSSPTKEMEGLILSGNLHHGGHKVLRWMAANVAVETDGAENIKPNRKKSSEKIDGIMATIMAIGRGMIRSDSPGSVYEQRGMLVL